MRARAFCGFCGAPLGPTVGNRQDCTGCGEPHYHDAKPCAAVLVVDQAGRVLLARRAIAPARGCWDIPGGFCGPDETPEACAIRELREETGCDIVLTAFLGHLIDVYGEGGDHTLNAVYRARIVAGEPVAADDVAELGWFALDALPAPEALAFATTAQALALLRAC
jgi:8-oxo-dGTP diphosphatase